jgi:ribonuclease J
MLTWLRSWAYPQNHIAISDIGNVIELTKKTIKFYGNVQAGRVLVDGTGIGDVGSVVLRDRKHLAQDGMLVVVTACQERITASFPGRI